LFFLLDEVFLVRLIKLSGKLPLYHVCVCAFGDTDIYIPNISNVRSSTFQEAI